MQHRIKPPDSNRLKGRASRFDIWARKLLLKRLALLDNCLVTTQEDTLIIIEQQTPVERRVVIRINNPRCYSHILLTGTTGAAESYILGYWDCDDLLTLIEVVLAAPALYEKLDSGWAWFREKLESVLHSFNHNSPNGSLKNIRAHYDLGNDFFSLFLDETMAYSSGIFETPTSTLHEASVAKFDRICRKINLSRHDTLIEIGTGWGGFAIHAAKHYGCRVTTTTIAREQYLKTKERVRDEKLEELVTVLDQDYRDLEGSYNKLVSIEMIEAVGHDYLDVYLAKCSSLLQDDGMMLIQGITVSDDRYNAHRRTGSFINKYIFPGSHLLSVTRVCERAAKVTDMFLLSMEDITPHYARTLHAWHQRFVTQLDAVRDLGMSEEFIRMWIFYLVFCEAGFSQRWTGDVHWVFGKPGCTPPTLPLGALP
ncbi:MAG: class I SAM-dependent methyltransferase [Kiritimatiellae bacterium]|nr:class I SAM-dependent methyltransferase [Kiritimatiellia bacterium]